MNYTVIFLVLLLFVTGCFFQNKRNTDIEVYPLGSAPSESDRQAIIDILQKSQNVFEDAIAGLTSDQLNFKSSSSKWSIAECIEHVTLAEMNYPDILEEELKKDPNPNFRQQIKITDQKIRPKMLSRFWKAKSPEIYKPSGMFNNAEIALDSFRQTRKRTMQFIDTTNHDLRNRFWTHRLTGVIDLYQTLILMSAHLERHTEQIMKIKSHPKFPK